MTDRLKAATAGSWRTTAAGLVTVLTAFGGMVLTPMLDDKPETVPMWAEFVPMAITAMGLLFARDNKVSSEAAGAKS